MLYRNGKLHILGVAYEKRTLIIYNTENISAFVKNCVAILIEKNWQINDLSAIREICYLKISNAFCSFIYSQKAVKKNSSKTPLVNRWSTEII